ncbi:MAG: Ig-like domain-containing protein [Thermoproteota archaeon]
MPKASFQVIPLGNRQVKLVAVLKDSSGNPVSGKAIAFLHKLSTDTTWTNDGTVNTDSTGTATMTITLTVPNTYDFQASFAGDSQYEASSASVTNYTVKDKTTLTLTVEPQ